LATPNYQYEKRQKALAKKKKQDEKRQRRLSKDNPPPQEDSDKPADSGKNEDPSESV